MDVNASFLRDDAGVPVGLIGTIRDISDRKHAEEAKQDADDQLHRAERISLIGQLAGGIAHDFNNVLAVIQGYSYVLQWSKDISAADKANVIEIQNASERSANLTRQLLTFGRQHAISIEPTNLNTLISSVEAMLSRLISESIRCVFIQSDALDTINCDTGQIEQLLTSLA